MSDSTHFIQHHTATLLGQQKREWDLFLYWMDQSDDEVMTTQKKQEFLDCLVEEEDRTTQAVLLQFPVTPESSTAFSQDRRRPQWG